MERLKRRVCHSQDRWSEDKEKEREKMTLCLYECLRAAGLQRHYTRFISVGVLRAAHLSALTMEDYPILGVRSMEDRTRLYDLVQMVKTFDLESLGDENGDADYDADPVADNSLPYDGSGDPDEDIYDDEDLKCVAGRNLNAASFSKPSCVRRRLDFGCKTIDHHKHPFSNPEGIFLVDSSHTRSDDPGQGSELDIPVQIKLNIGSAVCSCRGNNNHRMDVHSHQSDHLTDANTKSDIMEEMSLSNSRTMLSPNYVSFHKPKPRLATVSSNGFSHEPVEHKSRKGISRKENIGRYGASVHMAKPAPVYESKRTAGYNYGLPLSLPTLPNKKQRGGQRISVCVRKRPLTHTECRRGEPDVVTTSSGECVIVHECKEAVDLTQYILQHMFYFDQVFGEDSSNEEVYRRTAYPLVQHMLNGGKATCFAYGQTGAGKTHTMFGSSPGRPGLYTLAVRDIFAHLSTTPKQTALLVYVSFFEIYCGQMYDLLDHRKRLFAREDGQKVVHIAGLRDVRVDSVSSVLEVISQGTEERTQGISGVNPLSSRSHALLQIQLRGRNQQIAGRMWFVDLAGSERASDTKKSDRQSRMEGAEINQSLLALKECIRSLDQEQLHTPFRQSKLTQVLKDSFVGDSMTCMIANISPGHLATEHTLNTLRYADRVKELRGRGGQRRGRRGTTTPSPKHNLSNSSSSSSSEPRSVGIRGKSPPKKLKLVPQREALASTIPTIRLETEDAILCSTPKNSRLGKEGSARTGIGQIGQITPVKRFLEISDKRERAGGREVRSRERYGTTDVEAGLVLGQATDEQLHLWVQRESDLYHIERQNLQSTLKGRREGGRIQIEQREQVESIADTSSELERLRERDLRKVDERDKERKRYLRQYHQQLQQFMPSPVHHLSSSTCPSFPSSNQASLSSPPSPSTCPSLRHSSHLSVSATMYNDLEEVLDAYRVAAEVRADGRRGQLSFVPSGEICLQAETSPSDNRNKDGASHGDSGSTSEDWRVSLKGTEARFEQNRGRNENRKSLKETAEREVSVRWGDRRPDVLAGGGQRGWAWVATTETEEPNGMTGARQAQALLSYNCDLEERRGVVDKGINDSDVPAVGVWSTKEGEGADEFMLVSTHSNNVSHSPFNHSPFDSPTQHAPAERPLSPACEHSTKHLTHNKLSDLSLKLTHTKSTSDITPLPLQNAQQGVPSSSCRKKELSFAANVTNAQLATPALTTAITQNLFKIPAETLNTFYGNTTCSEVHNHPEVTSKMSVLPQEDTSTDHLSYAMYPQSISLLQVNQQAAKGSFILGEKNSTSLCQLDNERWEDNRIEVDKRRPLCAEMEGKVVEDEFSLLELPQGKIHCPSTTDTMTATNHSKQRKNMCCATYEHSEIGMMKPLIPEVILVSLQDQENNQKPQTKPTVTVLVDKAPASPLTCSSMQTSDMLSISPFGNTGTPSPHNVKINGATRKPPEYEHNVHKKLAFSISTPMSESVLGQLNKMSKQSHTVLSNHCSNQQIRPIVDLSTLENLDKGQCRVVQAHWEQLQEMEALFHKEGTLLCQQPDMAFGEYVYKLDEIMARKAQCVYSMIAQLQPYLKPSHSIKTHNQGEANHGPIT